MLWNTDGGIDAYKLEHGEERSRDKEGGLHSEVIGFGDDPQNSKVGLGKG